MLTDFVTVGQTLMHRHKFKLISVINSESLNSLQENSKLVQISIDNKV